MKLIQWKFSQPTPPLHDPPPPLYDLPQPYMTHPHSFITHPTPSWTNHPFMTYPSPTGLNSLLHDRTPPLHEPPHPTAFMTHPTPMWHTPTPPHHFMTHPHPHPYMTQVMNPLLVVSQLALQAMGEGLIQAARRRYWAKFQNWGANLCANFWLLWIPLWA